MKFYAFIACFILLAGCTQPEKPAEEKTIGAGDTVQVKDSPPAKSRADSMPAVDTTAMQLETEIPPVDKKKAKIHKPELVVEKELPDPDLVVRPDYPIEEVIKDEPAKPNLDEPLVFEFVEEMPSFKGDLAGYLSEHIQYPAASREKGIQGKVYLKFIVTDEGSVKDPIVLKGVNKELDAEALRLFKEMPANSWRPGKQNGKVVNAFMTMPVTFKLTE